MGRQKTFYVSTGWKNKDVAREVIGTMEAIGWRCSYDWTKDGDTPGEQDLAVIAGDEIYGVVTSDLMIVVLPGARGTHTELGAAIAAGKTVILHHSEPLCEKDPCPFYYHPQVVRTSDAWPDFLKKLTDCAKEITTHGR